MAHRFNLVQVKESIQSDDPTTQVTDPVCHMTFSRKESRHLLVREDQTFHFCSKRCLDDFVDRRYRVASELKTA